MSIFTPAEITANYSVLGKTKADKPLGRLFALAVLAGLFVGLGAVACNTATHTISDVSTSRIIYAIFFPFVLGILMLMGMELFTGNIMISISVLNGDTTIARMLRNWTIVYLGNFSGAMLAAFASAHFGQMSYSQGGLAVYTIGIAAAKCTLTFGNGVMMGVLCNILVCAGVLCSLSSKDTTGRILGAYLPVSFFVMCGFEHCVANMYYVPAGLFAMQVPEYATLANSAGIDVSSLTWGNFLLCNLLPVTLGNILGGLAFGATMWACHLKKASALASQRPAKAKDKPQSLNQ